MAEELQADMVEMGLLDPDDPIYTLGDRARLAGTNPLEVMLLCVALVLCHPASRDAAAARARSLGRGKITCPSCLYGALIYALCLSGMLTDDMIGDNQSGAYSNVARPLQDKMHVDVRAGQG